MAAIESSVFQLIKMLAGTKAKTKFNFAKTAILVPAISRKKFRVKTPSKLMKMARGEID